LIYTQIAVFHFAVQYRLKTPCPVPPNLILDTKQQTAGTHTKPIFLPSRTLGYQALDTKA